MGKIVITLRRFVFVEETAIVEKSISRKSTKFYKEMPVNSEHGLNSAAARFVGALINTGKVSDLNWEAVSVRPPTLPNLATCRLVED